MKAIIVFTELCLNKFDLKKQINFPGEDRVTPLMFAQDGDNEEMYDLFVKFGANENQMDDEGNLVSDWKK